MVSSNCVMKIGETAVLVIFIVIYVNLCDCELSPVPWAIVCIHSENCIFINVIVFYFVFSAVFIGEGQSLTISFTFWPYICKFVKINSKLLNTYENINVCAFVFFHTILTVAQSTQMTIIQFYLSANSVYLVIYILCVTPGGVLSTPQGRILSLSTQ